MRLFLSDPKSTANPTSYIRWKIIRTSMTANLSSFVDFWQIVEHSDSTSSRLQTNSKVCTRGWSLSFAQLLHHHFCDGSSNRPV
jgi:hypothetical protein